MSTLDTEWYSVTQTAARFGVSTGGIYRGVADGSIPSFRLGKQIRIPKEWVDSREATYGKEPDAVLGAE
jgi:excisionase family DNA binding protein